MDVPADGVLVHGLFMDSCRWDMETMKLVDALPGEMSAELPMLHMEPAMDLVPDLAQYEAPLYKTALRAGTLSTTGMYTIFKISALTWLSTVVRPGHHSYVGVLEMKREPEI